MSAKLSDLDTLFNVVAKKLGRIDVLFANAGIAKFAPVSDVSEDAFEETFDINVKGVFFTIQKAIPYLNDNAAVILNTSFVNQAGVPTTSIYAASKAAVRSLARGKPRNPGERGQPGSHRDTHLWKIRPPQGGGGCICRKHRVSGSSETFWAA